jgi:thiol-disulfide isomerase/thioredoxin
LEPAVSLSRSLKLTVLACAVLAPLLGGCDRQSGEQAQPQASASAAASGAAAKPLQGKIDRSHKGAPLPEFTLADAAGKRVQLQSLKGKPLLLNLWATWCAPCVVELPMLDGLAATKGDGLKVLTVSQDMQQTEKVAPFLSERGFRHLEPWLDAKNDLAFQYEVSTLPTTILYDAAGKEVWRYVGGHDWSSKETETMLAEADVK